MCDNHQARRNRVNSFNTLLYVSVDSKTEATRSRTGFVWYISAVRIGRNEFSRETRIALSKEHNRRRTQVPLRVPIKVNGTMAGGQPFEEETSTVMIDGRGAQIVLRNQDRLE